MRARKSNNIAFLTAEYILTKDELDTLWRSDNLEEHVMYEYSNEYQIEVSELEDREFAETEEFRRYFDDDMRFRAEETISMFNHTVINDDDTINIWRDMSVKKDWIEHLNTKGKHLGIYWSWDEQAAEAHWGHNTQNQYATIESRVDSEYIDWHETILVNMLPDSIEEKEIRLYKNTPLEIISLEIDNKDVTHLLTQKIFIS